MIGVNRLDKPRFRVVLRAAQGWVRIPADFVHKIGAWRI